MVRALHRQNLFVHQDPPLSLVHLLAPADDEALSYFRLAVWYLSQFGHGTTPPQ